MGRGGSKDCDHKKTRTETDRRAGTRKKICKDCGAIVDFSRIMTRHQKNRRDQRGQRHDGK